MPANVVELSRSSLGNEIFADVLRPLRSILRPVEFGAVAFGHQVMFQQRRRSAPGLQNRSGKTKRILGTDQYSYVSPVARALIGKAAGDVVLVADHEIEILSIESGPECQREQCYRAATWRVLTGHRWCLARGGL